MSELKTYFYSNKEKISKIDLKRLEEEILLLTRKSWGNPESLARRWLLLADYLVIVYKGKDLVAFAIGSILEKRTLNLTATVVNKAFSGRGLASKMNKLIITNFVISNFLPLVSGGLYFVFRTPNPKLYEGIRKKISVFPDYRKMRAPTKDELKIFRKVVKTFCPNNSYNEDKFIILGAYKLFPDLIYKSEGSIPKPADRDVYDFFVKNLSLKKKQGNTMVVVGRLDLFKYLIGVFK